MKFQILDFKNQVLRNWCVFSFGSFGIMAPTLENVYHRGVMRTLTDDCQFACVPKLKFYEILNKGSEHTRKVEDQNGQVVMWLENRLMDASGRRGPVLIKVSHFSIVHPKSCFNATIESSSSALVGKSSRFMVFFLFICRRCQSD
jgi:hypothetical protein